MSRSLAWILAAIVAAIIIITAVVWLLRSRDAGIAIPFINSQSASQSEADALYDPPSDFSSHDNNPPLPIINATPTTDFLPQTLPPTLN